MIAPARALLRYLWNRLNSFEPVEDWIVEQDVAHSHGAPITGRINASLLHRVCRAKAQEGTWETM